MDPSIIPVLFWSRGILDILIYHLAGGVEDTGIDKGGTDLFVILMEAKKRNELVFNSFMAVFRVSIKHILVKT